MPRRAFATYRRDRLGCRHRRRHGRTGDTVRFYEINPLVLAVGTHLFFYTREALALFRRHLAPGGIPAYPNSNRHLDLAPVLARLAKSTQANSTAAMTVRRIDTQAIPDRGELTASWVLLTADPTLFKAPMFQNARPVQTRPDVALWTDHYASLLPIVRRTPVATDPAFRHIASATAMIWP